MVDGRPSFDRLLMDTARLWATRSTCSKRQVGCVVSRDSRILVQGYNGAPAGMPHCDHTCDCAFGDGRSSFDDFQKGSGVALHHAECRLLQRCRIAEHAERNAVAYAARNGVALDGAVAHTTREPCLNCAMVLAGTGISEVVFEDKRADTSEGIEMLMSMGVQVRTVYE